MSQPSSPASRQRRVARPASPRQRGGVSSVLRLTQPQARSVAGPGFAHWLREAAVAIAEWPAEAEPAPTGSIITRLLPSRELVAR